jgi:two-component system sensor histidine kinase EvgS
MKLVITVLLIASLFGCTRTSKIELTKVELEYITEHPTVTYVAETNRPPYLFESSGKLQGMSQDYLDLISLRTGIKFIPVKFQSFGAGLSEVRARNVDIITAIKRNAERENYLNFSAPFSLVGGVTISKNKMLKTPNSIGVIRFGAVKKYAENVFPHTKIIEFDTDTLSFKGLISDEVDIIAMDLASYLWINPLSNQELNVSAIAYDYQYGFGMLKSNSVLNKIMSKALESVTYSERSDITRKWIKTEPSIN